MSIFFFCISDGLRFGQGGWEPPPLPNPYTLLISFINMNRKIQIWSRFLLEPIRPSETSVILQKKALVCPSQNDRLGHQIPTKLSFTNPMEIKYNTIKYIIQLCFARSPALGSSFNFCQVNSIFFLHI